MKRTDVNYKENRLFRKKIFRAILVIVSAIALIACGNSTNEGPEASNGIVSEEQLEKNGENIQEKKYSGLTEGDLKDYQFLDQNDPTIGEDEWDYLVYDEQGNIIQSVVFNSLFEHGICLDHWYNWKYDDDGKLIRQEVYYPYYDFPQPYMMIEYEHDENGRVVRGTEHTYSLYSDEEILEYEFEYNENGKLIKKNKKYDEDTSYDKYEYEYDAAGNKVKKLYYSYDELVGHMSYEYAYDNNGRLIEKKDVEGKGVHTYEYDTNGNLIRDNSVYSWIYEYDAQGNLLKKTCYEVDCLDSWEEYKYDEQGNLIKCTEYKAEVNGKYGNCWREYKYDEQGRRIREDFYRKNGELHYDKNEYVYDAMGRLVNAMNESTS